MTLGSRDLILDVKTLGGNCFRTCESGNSKRPDISEWVNGGKGKGGVLLVEVLYGRNFLYRYLRSFRNISISVF